MRRATTHMRHAAGFTLLEAIVAMVVMATSLLALYAWLGSSTIAVERASQRLDALEDSRAALAAIETMNPLLEPRGERRLGAIDVRWEATPLTERRAGLTRAGFNTLFEFVLYDVRVEVRRDGAEVAVFRLRRAGWEAVREFNMDEL